MTTTAAPDTTHDSKPATGTWESRPDENVAAHHRLGGDWEDVTIGFWHGEHDGKPVIQIDTQEGADFRVNVNDGTIWDQSPEAPSAADYIKTALADGSDDAMYEAVCRIADLYEIEIPED